MLYGICSVCQSKHPVVRMRGDYFLSTHDCPGSAKTCEGSGQLPEAVLGKLQFQQDMDDRDDWDDMAMCQDYWDSWLFTKTNHHRSTP